MPRLGRREALKLIGAAPLAAGFGILPAEALMAQEKTAKALKSAGKPVELVELDGEDHWLSRGATRLAMLKAAVAFLEKNNPPN